MEQIILIAGCIVFGFVFAFTNSGYHKAEKEVFVKDWIARELGAAFIKNSVDIYNMRHNPNASMADLERLTNKENELVEQYLDRVELASSELGDNTSLVVNLVNQFK